MFQIQRCNFIILLETYVVEDCIYYNANEWSYTTGSGMAHGFIFNNLNISNLPQHFLLSIDMKVSSNSGSEDRVWFTPIDFTGEQPSYGIGFQIASNGATMGIPRVNGSNVSYPSTGTSLSANTYATFKCERNGGTLSLEINDHVFGTATNQTWIDDYNNWKFGYSLWKRPSITCYAKNFKIKAL